jgi:hypothetical protein
VQAVLPGATATDFWSTAGTPIDELPGEIVMRAADVVDAALAGFDAGEFITIPALPDSAQQAAYEAARQAMLSTLSAPSRPNATEPAGGPFTTQLAGSIIFVTGAASSTSRNTLPAWPQVITAGWRRALHAGVVVSSPRHGGQGYKRPLRTYAGTKRARLRSSSVATISTLTAFHAMPFRKAAA